LRDTLRIPGLDRVYQELNGGYLSWERYTMTEKGYSRTDSGMTAVWVREYQEWEGGYWD
jgi:hypothetical protein